MGKVENNNPCLRIKIQFDDEEALQTGFHFPRENQSRV